MQLSYQTVQRSPRFGPAPELGTLMGAVAAAGWTAIGLDVSSIEEHCRSGGTIDELPAMLAHHGLVCTDVLPLVFSCDLSAAIADAEKLVGLTTTVGARICGAAFVGGDEAADLADPALVDTVRRCAGMFAEAGVRLAIEFLPYSPLRTLGQALDLCDAVGSAAGLMLDSWHVLAVPMPGDLSAIRALPADRIALLQIGDLDRVPGADVLVGEDLIDASRNHRLLPGEGSGGFEAFTDAVRATGYDGVISPEVLSRDARASSPGRFETDLLAAARRCWPYGMEKP